MAKSYSVSQFKQLLTATLKQELANWEQVFVDLRKAELTKGFPEDTHLEPGVHMAPDSGVAPHLEPGGLETHDMGPGASNEILGQQSVGSATGIPMDAQPSNSTPGGMLCPTCGNEDKPGSCTCLEVLAGPESNDNTDGFDRPDPELGQDAQLGGGSLQLAELETGGNMRMAEATKGKK